MSTMIRQFLGTAPWTGGRMDCPVETCIDFGGQGSTMGGGFWGCDDYCWWFRNPCGLYHHWVLYNPGWLAAFLKHQHLILGLVNDSFRHWTLNLLFCLDKTRKTMYFSSINWILMNFVDKSGRNWVENFFKSKKRGGFVWINQDFPGE